MAAKTTPFIATLALVAAAAFAAAWAGDYAGAQAVTLLNTQKTNAGQPIAYVRGKARIESAIVTLPPGGATGRHMHPVPTYGYVMQGEVTVAYDGLGAKTYRAGDAFMEAERIWHDGRNTGSVPTKILVVFMGADGVPNVVRPR